MHHLRAGGWDGVRVNAFRGELRTQWFPVPAARRLAEVGAPGWAVEIFDCLRAVNGGTLSGFFDVFAWREPGGGPPALEVRVKTMCRTPRITASSTAPG